MSWNRCERRPCGCLRDAAHRSTGERDDGEQERAKRHRDALPVTERYAR
ncbi:hypothetical protein [Haloarcula sp. Atlit-47R]|nr:MULTISPECIES: hypothetical protein [Haloarcula]